MSGERANAVYVTGASRGVGRLLGLHLARRQTSVVAMARPSDDMDSLARDAGDARLTAVAVDVIDPAAVRAAFTAAAKQVGPPTTLITCAGSIDALGPVAEVDPDRWWSAVAVDLRGTMLTAQAALTWMLPSHWGPHRHRVRQPRRPRAAERLRLRSGQSRRRSVYGDARE